MFITTTTFLPTLLILYYTVPAGHAKHQPDAHEKAEFQGCHMCEFPAASQAPVRVSIPIKEDIQCHVCTLWKPGKTPSQLAIELWASRELNISCQKNVEKEEHRTMERILHLDNVAPHVLMESN